MTRTNLSNIQGLAIIALFAVAMGYLESAVVVYLRQIYYPEGFAFPLKAMDLRIAVTELGREAATLLMLLAIGWIAGRTRTGKFGIFLFTFGTWDIFYYVFLKLLLNWPESLMTWDILFLLPTTWVGPVLAPVINSVSMIIFGGMLYYFDMQGHQIRIRTLEWTLLACGSLIVLWTYMEDYVRFLRQEYGWSEMISPIHTEKMMELATRYVPADFSWLAFGIGQLLIVGAIWLCFNRNRCKHKP